MLAYLWRYVVLNVYIVFCLQLVQLSWTVLGHLSAHRKLESCLSFGIVLVTGSPRSIDCDRSKNPSESSDLIYANSQFHCCYHHQPISAFPSTALLPPLSPILHRAAAAITTPCAYTYAETTAKPLILSATHTHCYLSPSFCPPSPLLASSQ
jgi:hypothetical protein